MHALLLKAACQQLAKPKHTTVLQLFCQEVGWLKTWSSTACQLEISMSDGALSPEACYLCSACIAVASRCEDRADRLAGIPSWQGGETFLEAGVLEDLHSA
jgi:hypothetical protein